jgi:membrane protein YdbS with pleckstrin-like domain
MAIADDLITGETIVLTAEKHWIAPIRASLVAGLMVIGAVVLRAITPNGDGIVGWIANVLDLIATGLLIAGILWIAYNVVLWRTAEFAVTNLRVLREEGLVRHRSSTTMLSSLSDVRSEVGALGKQLGYGDLVILTTSGSAGEDRFTSITKPVAFRNAVMEQKVTAGRSDAAAAGAAGAAAATAVAPAKAPTAPAPETAAPDDAATLLRLADLRDKGAITPAEYESKKAEILARM